MSIKKLRHRIQVTREHVKHARKLQYNTKHDPNWHTYYDSYVRNCERDILQTQRKLVVLSAKITLVVLATLFLGLYFFTDTFKETHDSIAFAPPPVSIVSSAASTPTNCNPCAATHTVQSGDTLLLVAIGFEPRAGETITAVTFAGTPLTLIRTDASVSASTSWWMLTNPPTVTDTISVTYSGTMRRQFITPINARGVDLANPLPTHTGAVGTAGLINLTLATLRQGSLILDAAFDRTLTMTPLPGRTQLWNSGTGGPTTGAGSVFDASLSGNYSLTWSAQSNWAASAIVLQPIQGIPLGVTIIEPQNISYANGTIPLTIELDRAGTNGWYSLNGGVTNTSLVSQSATTFNGSIVLPDGSYTAHFFANDSIGNTNFSESVTFTISTDNYVLTIISPTQAAPIPTTSEQNLTIQFNVSNNGVAVTQNSTVLNITIGNVQSSIGDAWIEGTTWFVNTTAPSGLGGLQDVFLEVDINATARVSALEFNALDYASTDNIPPSVQISSPNATTYANATIQINISLNEDGDSVFYSLDNGLTNSSLTSINNREFTGITVPLTEGTYNMRFFANDTTGNTNNSENVSFEINFAPSVPTEITCNGDSACNQTVQSNIELIASGATDADSITYVLEALLSTPVYSANLIPSPVQIVSSSTSTPIEFQGFEAGTGGWVSGGADSSRTNTQSYVTDTGALGGTWSWHLQDNSASSFVQKGINLAGFEQVVLAWSSLYTNVNPGELLTLYCDTTLIWSDDASASGTLGTWVQHSTTITPADCAFDTNTVLRFESEFSNNGDNVEIDGINITGIGAPQTEITTTPTQYATSIPTTYSEISSITLTLDVSTYAPSGSIANNNAFPDIAVSWYNGSAFVSTGALGITSTGIVTRSTTQQDVLIAWQNPLNRQVQVNGILFDANNTAGNDAIEYVGLNVSIATPAWEPIGNHSEGSSLLWDTTNLIDQSCIDIRARAFDSSGSMQFSDYYTHGACLTINAQNDGPTLTSISEINNQIVTEAGITQIFINITASDPDGVADLNTSALLVIASLPGEDSRTASCNLLNILDTSTAQYECVLDMHYWDGAGTWSLQATIADNAGATTTPLTSTFLLLETSCITLTPSSLAFSTVFPGTANAYATNDPIQVQNTCNREAALSITGSDAIGQSNAAESIPATAFRINTVDNQCATGTQLQNGSQLTIAGAFLSAGNNSANEGFELLYTCIELVPSEISAQAYQTPPFFPWEIGLLLAAVVPKKRKKSLSELKEQVQKELGMSAEEVLAWALKTKAISATKQEHTTLEIPLQIIRSELGPAQAVYKYLKENKKMSYHEIGAILNRDERTIWVNYHKACSKRKKKLSIAKEDSLTIPISVLSSRSLSMLEAIAMYFKQKGYTNALIGEILGMGINNVWTVLARAKKKEGLA